MGPNLGTSREEPVVEINDHEAQKCLKLAAGGWLWEIQNFV